MKNLYSTVIASKTGLMIPVFNSGKPMNSKYDPEREALSLFSAVPESDFYIILGAGSCILLEKLYNRSENSFFFVIESSSQDISFIKNNFSDSEKYFSKKNVIFTSFENFQEELFSKFVPARFKTLSFVETRSWCNELGEDYQVLRQTISETIKSISADFSVQSHFGKIWQKNIISNLKLASKNRMPSFDLTKTALIVAAGPSLDSKIDYIKENRSRFFIISTDTAYSNLSKHGILCDSVCSLDGQNISTKHFSRKITSETLFIFDLQANHNAVKKIINLNGQIIFTQSGHPLAQYASLSQKKNCFSMLQTGSGTVTIQAVDFAAAAGFKNIELLGADFSYPFQKPYARGTYLDAIYSENACRLTPTESSYSRLMFRTPLINQEERKTTEILDSYRISFLNWLKSRNFNFVYSHWSYKISGTNTEPSLSASEFDYSSFFQFISSDLEKFKNTGICPDNLETALLPFVSYLSVNQKASLSYKENLKLALENIVRYT